MDNPKIRAKVIRLFAISVMTAVPVSVLAETSSFSGYLFTYFKGNHIDDEAICFAISDKDLNFKALNGNEPVLDSKKISSTGGMRDPHILRTEDGKHFYMVATDMVSANGWDSNRAMVLMKSNNLTDWTSSVVNIQKILPHQENLKRVWAPQTIYDPSVGKYMIYWSMQYGDGPDVIYYAYANKEFTGLATEPHPLFIPEDGKSCIDGDIVLNDGTYYLFYKTEGHGNGIRVATNSDLTSGKWKELPDYKQQTADPVEGAGVFRNLDNDHYILMYDVYTKGRYEFAESKDLVNFTIVDDKVRMNFHPRHGSVIPITEKEKQRLIRKWNLK